MPTIDNYQHDINKTYPNYGGLDRQALFFGIPVVVAMLILVGATVPAIILVQFFSAIWGLFCVAIAAAVLFHLHNVCSDDDQAMRITGFELLCFLRRKNARIFGGKNTILSTRYGRHKSDYQRLLEQYSETATCNVRFSTEDLPTLDSRNSQLY
ncbi:MAG: VirB3 family type IV secretion system protein [Neisseriaceae bacterium]|nr:VirB3 family type IV secretion system protein [Neisseriaceae bacterium]